MIKIKTEFEIGKMRDSGRLTKDVLEYIKSEIKPGMTTYDIDKLAY